VSSIYNRLSRAIFEIPVSDTNSMKAFRRDILDEVRLRHDWHRFFVVLAYARGYSITEIDIALHPRRARHREVLGPQPHRGRHAGHAVRSVLPVLLAQADDAVRHQRPHHGGERRAGGPITIVLRIMHVMPPFGFRPLLYLVILLEVLGFLLFGFGFIAELVAQQHAELDALHREVARRGRAEPERARDP
jgi:hypothetical protein